MYKSGLREEILLLYSVSGDCHEWLGTWTYAINVEQQSPMCNKSQLESSVVAIMILPLALKCRTTDQNLRHASFNSQKANRKPPLAFLGLRHGCYRSFRGFPGVYIYVEKHPKLFCGTKILHASVVGIKV